MQTTLLCDHVIVTLGGPEHITPLGVIVSVIVDVLTTVCVNGAGIVMGCAQ
jgi:hypothetical protein